MTSDNDQMNWDNCIICQNELSEKLQCPGNSKEGAGYDSFVHIFNELTRLGKLPKQTSAQLLQFSKCKSDITAIFRDRKAKWHRTCRLYFSTSRLNRAQAKQSQKVESESNTRTRSCTNSDVVFESRCFFCEKADGELHLSSTFQLDKNVRRCATELNDTNLLAKLSAGDMISQDAMYHTKCLANLYNKVRPTTKDENLRKLHEFEGIALAELCSYIEEVRMEQESEVFILADLVKLYTKRVEQLYGLSLGNKVNSTHLKNRILSHIPDIRAHRHGKNTLLAFEHDIGGALDGLGNSYDDDAFILAKCASVIRRDLAKHKAVFRGTFKCENQTEAVPESLKALVGMILGGPNIESQTNRMRDAQSTLSVAQLLLFNYTSSRNANVTSVSYYGHSTDREPPLPVYLGLKVHAETRKRGLIDTLYNFGLSISYDRLLTISTALGNMAVERYQEDQLVCPEKLRFSVFTTSAVDNIDHNPSSNTAEGSLHGTAISGIRIMIHT